MMDLFGVEQYQEVECDKCKTITKKTEPLLGLVLSLPEESKHVTGNADDAAAQGSDVHLLDCFKSLQATGRFEGQNQFDCDVCRAKQDAEWRVALKRRPPSLLISLRRTLWDSERGLHKDGRMVKFPLKLDTSELLGVGRGRSPDDDFVSCHYELVAVVSHSGSSPFVGHYICYARNDDRWFLFNDARVTPATESSVLEVEAFILLYEMCRIPSING